MTCTLLPQHAAHASRFLYIGTACGSVLVFDTIALRLSNVQFAAPAATVMSPSTSASASSSSGLFRIPAFAGDSTETVFDAVTALCAHASDPALIYVGYSSGVVCLWSAQTRKVRQRWMAPTQTAAPVAVTALAAHPAGMDEKDCKSAALIAGHADGTLIAWAHTSSGTSSSPAWQTAVAAPPSADSALAAESIAADDKPSGIVQLAWSSAGVWVAGGHVANQQLAGLRLLPSDRVASAAKPTCADFELAGCASNGVWLAAASSALLAGAVAAQQPSPLGGIGSQTVVDFLSDAAAVRAFALPTNVAGNATASATASASANVNGPIVWATSAGEVWVARRPGYDALI